MVEFKYLQSIVNYRVKVVDREFIKEIQKYLPVRSREDAGVDFNLKKIHIMIDEHLKTNPIGNPEITRKWTQEMGTPKFKPKKPIKKQVTIEEGATSGGEVWL